MQLVMVDSPVFALRLTRQRVPEGHCLNKPEIRSDDPQCGGLVQEYPQHALLRRMPHQLPGPSGIVIYLRP